MFLTSKLLAVPHGFSVREGGVSGGAFQSLNLSFAGGDDAAKVRENHRRLAEAGGFALAELHTVSQVHGDAVLEVDAAPAAEALRSRGEADALWTSRAEAAVGIRTADCVPILLADAEGRRVAAIHSGWRGTELRIAARTVQALVDGGARRESLVAAVGPCIQRCCYEVSDELAERFHQRFGPEVVNSRGGRRHLDLARAVALTLRAAGVGDARLDVLPGCTACDAERFFSHRRDKGVTGRHLAFAVCRF